MKWKDETRKIKDLKGYAKNPRSLSKVQAEHLETSVKTFGQCQPIVINPDGLIIGGHQRVKTMKKLGYKEVSCLVPEKALTEKQVEELNIRLNRNLGDWDWDVLGNAFEVEDLLDYGFSLDDLHLDGPDVEEGSEEDPEQKAEIHLICSSKRELEKVEVELEKVMNHFPDVTKKVKVK